MMAVTADGAVLKLPPLSIIKRSRKFSCRSSVSLRTSHAFSCQNSPAASAVETATAPVSSVNDSKLGPGSLGHLTRPDFPILQQEVHGKKLVYLDNAATSQKPAAVIRALHNYYETFNSNVHRGVHCLSWKATEEYELARRKVANFINAPDSKDVVFTRNATEAINLVANSWGLNNLRPGDEVVLTVAEHHSAIVPWQLVAQKTGAVLKFVGLTEDEVPDLEQLHGLLSKKTKLVVIQHVSNVLGRRFTEHTLI